MRETLGPQVRVDPGSLKSQFNAELAGLVQGCFASRLCASDSRLFGDADERRKVVSNRLGWVAGPAWLEEHIPELIQFAGHIRDKGFAHVLLLGMGGSSLCPEVLASMFPRPAHLKSFNIVDTTDPRALLRLEADVDLSRTLFVVSSKSGSTVETRSQMLHFLGRLEEIVPAAGAHFVAITDSGSELERFGREHAFDRVFLNPEDIGGRYSALSYFGMVPAALLCAPLAGLAAGAHRLGEELASDDESNPALNAGALLGAGARRGLDKLTFVASPSLVPVVPWIEQLVAESTGKAGRGVIPIEAEPQGDLRDTGLDRVYCLLRMSHEAFPQPALPSALQKASIPSIEIECRGTADLAALFLLWEYITAAAGRILDINPFDEPNVKESKDNTVQLLEGFKATGRFNEPAAKVSTDSFEIATESVAGMDIDCMFASLLQGIAEGDYLAFLHFGDRTQAAEAALQSMRRAARAATGVATLRGYGPRYLHSIGQLYKGGPSSGHFVVFLSPGSPDLGIPGSPFSFGELLTAQALGDYRALSGRRRPCLWVRLTAEPEEALSAFANSWNSACARITVRA